MELRHLISVPTHSGLTIDLLFVSLVRIFVILVNQENFKKHIFVKN